MKRIIIFLSALAFAAQASAIHVMLNNNTTTCDVDITVTPVDGTCAPTAAPASISAMPPGNTFEIVDGTGAVDFQIDIAVVDINGTVISMNTFYADGTAACTGGVVSGTTGVTTMCSGTVVNATVTFGGGIWTVSIN